MILIRSLSESVERSSLSLKSIDDVLSSNSLSLGVFSVGNWVSDNVTQETLEDLSDFLVDSEWDSLDTSSSGESSDGWFGNSLYDWSGSSRGSDSFLWVNFSIGFSALSGFAGHLI